MADGPAPTGARLFSLDIFRAFVILMMFFQGYAIGVVKTLIMSLHGQNRNGVEMANVLDSLRHTGYGADVISLSDLIFPGFLFAVGLAIPFAFRKRLEAGQSVPTVLAHAVLRTGGLLLLGLMMYSVNQDRYSEVYTGISEPAWYLLFYSAVVLLWITYPPGIQANQTRLVRGLRWGAAAVLVILFAVLRIEGPHGEPRWFIISWGEPVNLVILDIIGWTYLFSSVIYLFLVRVLRRGIVPALAGVLLYCTAFYSAVDAGWLHAINTPWLNLPKLFGSWAIPVLAGVVAGRFLLETPEPRRRMVFLLLWAAVLLGLGFLLRPLQPINRVDAPASYALIAAGINGLCFLGCFVVYDVLRKRWLAALLMPVGANALLAYLLPEITNEIVTALKLRDAFWASLDAGGLQGVVLMTAVIGLFILVLVLLSRSRMILRV